jgi:CheY-specific phosphatase CheX
MATSTQSNDFDAEKWVSAIHQSLQTVACETLGVEEATITRAATHPAEASKIKGAYISLVEGDFSALLGLRGSRDDCEHLARMMLELADDETAAEEDVSGTISELANIIAGVVKSKIGIPDLKLGIPMVVSGRVTPANQQEAASDLVRFGPVSLEIFLLYRRKRARKSAA